LAVALEQQDRSSLLRQGIRLEYLTVSYNAIEAVVAVGAGLAAGSVALVGFGFDSLIEIAAGGTLLWRLKKELQLGRELEEDEDSTLERKASFVIGLTFFALAIYILAEAAYKLIAREGTTESTVGIILAAISLAVMPFLALAKQRVAARLGSRSLASDAKETWVCTYLSLVLLAGLLLNAAFGWSWADPIAALAMLPLVLREGLEALTGDDD
jgi:divalent metal cation (Fe/Co/Zn/Cd) transporter